MTIMDMAEGLPLICKVLLTKFGNGPPHDGHKLGPIAVEGIPKDR